METSIPWTHSISPVLNSMAFLISLISGANKNIIFTWIVHVYFETSKGQKFQKRIQIRIPSILRSTYCLKCLLNFMKVRLQAHENNIHDIMRAKQTRRRSSWPRLYQTKLLSNWKTYLCFFGSISGLSCLNTFILNYLGCLSVEDYLTHFMWDFHIIKLLWQQMFLWSFVFFFIFQKVTCAKSHTFLTWKFGNPGSILIFFCYTYSKTYRAGQGVCTVKTFMLNTTGFQLKDLIF